MAVSKPGLSFSLALILIFSFLLIASAASATSSEEDEDPDNILYEHLASTGSTQDEARRIVTQHDPKDYDMVCVTATEQSNGRGTSGRAWMGKKGNTFVTIAIPTQQWLGTKIPLTLLPLKIGIIVARQINELLQRCQKTSVSPESQATLTTLKWPNDILVDEKKIAGILIESSDNAWFLIGIGVNLAYAPPIPTDGPNHGRKSTSLSQFCDPVDWEEAAHELGVNLAKDLHEFLSHPDKSPEAITSEWKQWVDYDMELVMRDTPKREKVKLVGMLPDGRIQVVGSDDGVQRTLVSDYFL